MPADAAYGSTVDTQRADEDVTTRRMPYAVSTGTMALAWARPTASSGRSWSSWLQRDRGRALA